jgi:hypothetical protein
MELSHYISIIRVHIHGKRYTRIEKILNHHQKIATFRDPRIQIKKWTCIHRYVSKAPIVKV